MYTRESLEKMDLADLDKICVKHGINYYSVQRHIRKSEQIDRILSLQVVNNIAYNPDVDREIPVEVKEHRPWDLKNKDEYINKAEKDALFAFVDERGKARTGKLLHRSSKRRLIKVLTDFDREFIVPYDNVLWVRNGSKWPRSIYLMLKGRRETNVQKAE